MDTPEMKAPPQLKIKGKPTALPLDLKEEKKDDEGQNGTSPPPKETFEEAPNSKEDGNEEGNVIEDAHPQGPVLPIATSKPQDPKVNIQDQPEGKEGVPAGFIDSDKPDEESQG